MQMVKPISYVSLRQVCVAPPNQFNSHQHGHPQAFYKMGIFTTLHNTLNHHFSLIVIPCLTFTAFNLTASFLSTSSSSANLPTWRADFAATAAAPNPPVSATITALSTISNIAPPANSTHSVQSWCYVPSNCFFLVIPLISIPVEMGFNTIMFIGVDFFPWWPGHYRCFSASDFVDVVCSGWAIGNVVRN